MGNGALVLGLAADWWRRNWHNVVGGFIYLVILVVLCVFADPLGGGL